MAGVEGRRLDRVLQAEAVVQMAKQERRLPLFLLVAAGRAKIICGLPSFRAIDGLRVVRGRRPGPSELASPSASQNICARELRQKPSSGIVGEDCSQPPDGVADTILPSASITSMWTVSPRGDVRCAIVGS